MCIGREGRQREETASSQRKEIRRTDSGKRQKTHSGQAKKRTAGRQKTKTPGSVVGQPRMKPGEASNALEPGKASGEISLHGFGKNRVKIRPFGIHFAPVTRCGIVGGPPPHARTGLHHLTGRRPLRPMIHMHQLRISNRKHVVLPLHKLLSTPSTPSTPKIYRPKHTCKLTPRLYNRSFLWKG